MPTYRTLLRRSRGAVEVLENQLRPDFRRACLALALAIAALVAGSDLGGIHAPQPRERLIVVGLAAAYIVFGVVGTRSAANQVAKAAGHASLGARSTAKLLCQLFGYAMVFFGAVGILTIPLQQLLVGGALTGVIVGIAAQQPLSNLFAGLVLLMARPITVGERVRVYSGALGGPLDGLVTEMGLIYTVLNTDEAGVLRIPNVGLLSAAIGTGSPPGEVPDGPAVPGAPDAATGVSDDRGR